MPMMMQHCAYCFPWIFPLLMPILIPILFPMSYMMLAGRGFGFMMRNRGDSAGRSGRDDPRSILKMRLAKGEITKEEYEQIKATLDD